MHRWRDRKGGRSRPRRTEREGRVITAAQDGSTVVESLAAMLDSVAAGKYPAPDGGITIMEQAPARYRRDRLHGARSDLRRRRSRLGIRAASGRGPAVAADPAVPAGPVRADRAACA